MVGAIHGRLLTAWSVAGVLGPVLVNYLNDWQIKSGVEKAAAYDTTMYVLSGLLVVGFICNLLVRPVADKWFMTDEELAAERKLAHDKAHADVLAEHAAKPSDAQAKASSPLLVFGFWILVLVPIAWGVWMTILQALALF